MMTFNRVSPVCLLLCLAALVPTANAQTLQNTATPSSGGYQGDATGYSSAGDFRGSYILGNDGGTYIDFQKMIGNGPGYSNGFSRIGIRAKVFEFGDGHLWTSGSALITDDTRVGVNVGTGYRWLYDSNIVGVHGWYDSYQTNNGNRYDQLTGGFELLHEDIDLRVNGYMPINQTENFLRVTDPGTVPVFTQRGIGFLGRGLDEQALKGIDAEVGTAIMGVNWARVYGGGYWYEGKNTEFGGVRGRVETAISPDLSLNFIASNDSQFDTNYQLSVEYRFSGGISPGFCTPFHGENRKYNQVQRVWPVATQVVEIDKTVPMLNPDGTVMTAAFVNNTNPDPGDGSFKNPYSFLPPSDDADKIFVFAGVGATDGYIALRDNQQLLGEGKLYTFDDPIRGTVTVPEPFMSTGPRPLLEAADPSRNVITLANNNRVANFDILGPATAAIGGTNITGFEIDMVVGAGVTDGIHIENASGRGIIRDSAFSVADQGIYVSNTSGGPLNLSIERGVGSITSIGGREGIHVAADGADINLVMNNVRVDNATETGIRLDATMGGRLTAVVDEARVKNTMGVSGDGFLLNVDSAGSMNVALTNIGARGNGDLFVVDANDGNFVGTVGGGITGITAGADFSDSVTGSGVRLDLTNATGMLAFENLYANRNAVDGIESSADGAGTDFFLSVIDSRTMANFGKGVEMDVSGGADFRYYHDPSYAINNQGGGLSYDVRDPGSVFIADILQTDFSNNMGHAIDGHVSNGAYANVDLTQTPAINVSDVGYNLLVEQNATFVGTISQAQFNSAGDATIDLTVRDGSSANLTMNDVQSYSNGHIGLRYLVEGGANGGSNLLLGVTNGNFNTNPDSNIVGTSRGAGSVASVYLNNVTADGQAANGSVVLNAEMGGVLNQNWNGGSISQGQSDGVVARVDGAGSQIRMNYNNVSIRTNAGDGIDGTIVNGGPGSLLNISLANSTVSQNGVNGIDLSLDGAGARSNVTIDNAPIVSNFAGDGLEFDVMGGAGLGVTASGGATSFVANGARAWDGSVSGAGSFATLNLDGTDASASGLEGGLFEVTAGGLLNLNLSNLEISDNNLDGLLTTVDGAGSRANLNLDLVNVNRNGLSLVGDGFEARASNGGRINANLSNMMVTNNRDDGLKFTSMTGGLIQTTMSNIVADANGRNGLAYRATAGGRFEGNVSSSSFSNNGAVVLADGVLGVADGAGSDATGIFTGVTADNNSRNGFEFDVRSGARLVGDIRSDSVAGNSSASGNAMDGVRFNALDAGTMGFLKMMGPNTFNNNVAGDGVDFDAENVAMAVANVTGSASGNSMDGINVRMVNVGQGAISLQGAGTGQITGNGDDGIEITTQNVNLVDKTVNGMLIQAFQIDGFTITGNGGDPIVINMTDTNIQDGEITNNIIDGGQDGINVHLGAGDGDLLIDNNTITGATRYGIAVTSDAGTHKVSITNNSVTSSGDTNIFVDLFGTTQTGLMINDNTVIGGGMGQGMFTTGTNFLASTSPASGFIPPDTMGAVGPDQVVELLNGVYAVYDKTTGAQLFQSTLDEFFTAAGLPQGPAGVRFDPRIIYDPTVDRWFAAGIDADPGNLIYVAVSLTSNPLDGFQGVSFVADSVDGSRFNDFVTLGVDANGVYFGTNNFFGPNGFDVSIFSIPKADLLAAVPTAANLSRQEGLDASIYGETPQPVVNFGPASPTANFLTVDAAGGSQLTLTSLTGAGTPTATLGAPQAIPVATYFPAPNARQPAAPSLENVTPRFNGNVVEVNGSIWGVHAVLGSTGNSALRWYEIDSATGNVLQTGTIEDPNVDYLDASIAVNPVGAVMIGFTGSGPTQNPSSMAAFGTTAGGMTTFQSPTILQAGNTSYFEDFGSGRNRWGDYSATVVDPSDPNSFWTFQELAVGPSTWGVQVTQVNFSQAIFGDTVNDGIHVNVRENARLTDSMINGNTVTNHGDDGIEVVVTDAGSVDNLMIDANTSDSNGDDGIRFDMSSTGSLAGLSVSGNTSTNNTGDGLEVLINAAAGTPDIMVNTNLVTDNGGRGITVTAKDMSVDDVSVSMNMVRDNGVGNGILLDIDNTTGGVRTADTVRMIGNTVSGAVDTGVLVNLNNLTGMSLLDVSMSNVNDNLGGGIEIHAAQTPITLVNLDSNNTNTNTGGDGLFVDLLNSPVSTLNITNSSSNANMGDGVDLNLDGSAIGTLNIADNNTGGVASTIGLSFFIDGDTFTQPFSILNTSAAGTDITGFMLDISTAFPSGLVFDTEGGGGSTPFQPQANSDVLTGLLTVNGNAITPGTNPLQDAMGNVLPGGGVPDNAQLLDLTFADFNAMESFQWVNDLDPSPTMTDSIFGNQMIGSLIRVDFTGGQFLTGALMPVPGNADASTFVATGGTITGAPGFSNNLGDGLKITQANGSNIGAFTLDNNVIDGNGINGVELLVSDSTLPAVGSPTIVSGNSFSGNTGDGFRLINPDTNGTPFGIVFTDNTASDNGGVGINIELNADSGGLTTTATGNTISNNGGIGASFVVQDDATLDLTFGDSAAAANVLEGNVDAGIAVKTKDDSMASIVVQNTMVSGTVDGPNLAFGGDGLAVHSSGNSIVSTMTVGDDTLSNTSFNGNAGNGIDIDLSDNARNPNILIQNVMTNNNGGHGIGIVRTGFSTFTEDLDSDGMIDPGEDVNGDGMLGNAMITKTTANGNGGNGLDVNVTGAALPIQQIDVFMNQNSFNMNTIGMNFVVGTDASLLVNAANNVVSGNTSHGISVTTNQNSAFGNVLASGGDPNSPLAIPSVFSSNIVTSNGGNGFNFVANGSSVQVIDVDDAGAVNPSTGTSRTVIDGNGGNQVQVTGNNTSQQNVDLTAVNITNVNNVATGDGVNIDANGSSTVSVSINGGATGPSIIGASIAHVSVPGLGGPGGVANGIAADVADQAILNLDVSNVRLYNNTGDGIVVTNSAPGGLNGSDVGFSGGNRQTIQANFDMVDARLNGDQGLDVRLTGNIGGRAAQGDTDAPVLINVTNSNFSSNANEGIFFQTDTGFTQDSEIQINNPAGPAQNPLFNTFNGAGGGRDSGGFTNGFNQATRAGQFNLGRYDGTDFEWNNLYSDLVATFNVVDSTITTNGTGAISDGLVMRVSTNSYVGANISGNMFGANSGDDFHTESFITTNGIPSDSIDNDAPAFDSVFLDDTAQMDLAFQDNSGDHIRVSALGAFYTNADPAKQNTRPNGPTNRRGDIFILDSGLTVQANNMFQLFGVPQMEVFGPDGFSTNGYFIRLGSNHLDPAFPAP